MSIRVGMRNYRYRSDGAPIYGDNVAEIQAARHGSEKLLQALKRYAVNNANTISGAHILRSVA